MIFGGLKSFLNMMSPLDYEAQLHNHAQEVTF